LEIRKKITETLASIDKESEISPHLRAMRAACRKFMDDTERKYRGGYADIFTALGEMRGIFGVHIAQLCVKYGVDVEGDLSAILPTQDDEKEEMHGRIYKGKHKG
jgi:hypothetical protein